MAIEPLNIGGIAAVKGIRGEFAGMKEAIMFISYMSGSQKNRAIRKAYVIATKVYRKELKAVTKAKLGNKYPPSQNVRKKGKPLRKLWQTVGFAPSKKHLTNSDRLVSPLWVGHMVKRGAYHQHFIVRGTKAYKQDHKPLKRKAKDGRTKRRGVLLMTGTDGRTYFGREKKYVRGKAYVDSVAKKNKVTILNGFGDSFVLGMKKEARTARYRGYLSY